MASHSILTYKHKNNSDQARPFFIIVSPVILKVTVNSSSTDNVQVSRLLFVVRLTIAESLTQTGTTDDEKTRKTSFESKYHSKKEQTEKIAATILGERKKPLRMINHRRETVKSTQHKNEQQKENNN